MDENEKLSRIKSLLGEKKKEENVFSLKIKQLNEEIYAKQINPLLINYLNFTSSSAEKLEKAIDKAGGKFVRRNYQFTRSEYEKGIQIFKSGCNMSEFFQIFGAVKIKESKEEFIYEFLNQIEEIIKDLDFARKHSYLDSSLEQISFRKYIKVVYDDRIEILKRPLEHLTYIKIHGIWEIIGNTPNTNELSYLLCHCTKSYESCWPIISEGLKISKSVGGRCGKGIYFSNDIAKCLQYTTFTNLGQKLSFSLLFFAQIFIGKIRKINDNDPKLTISSEYDTILANGRVSPKISTNIWHSDGTSSWIFIDEPSNTNINSSFYNNEYVIYDENRSILRYIILISKDGY